MSTLLSPVRSWLAQTSTKGAIVYLAGLLSAVLAHTMTKDAALSLGIPAALGLVFNDVTLIGNVSSVVTPVVQAVVSKPTLASAEAAVVAAEPKAAAMIPAATTEALNAFAPAGTVAAAVEAMKAAH